MSSITVHIKTASGTKHTVKVNPAGTVVDLRKAIEDESKVPADQQRLIFKGKVLRDAMTLADVGLEDECTVHMVRSQPAPTTTTPTPTSAPAPAPVPGAFGAFGAQPQGGAPNPFAAFPGMGGIGGTPGGMPDVSRMQQQLLQNPEMMASIMNSPMMQNLMSNPDLIRNMIVNNPQMRQVLDANPQLNHVLNDPALMRQAMEYMANPQAMQQMMRSQDLAMSQIENHPEGFNALRRMYNEVNEPMYEAMTQGFQQQLPQTSTTTGTTAAPSTGAGPNTAALPNPWAARPATTGAAPTPSPFGATGTGTGTGATPLFPNLFGANPANPGAMGAPPTMDTTMQMMQNPMMQTMMQQMLQNPAFIDQMAAQNPMLRQMMDQNPQVRTMMTDPHFIQQVTNPANLQAMMQLQQSGLLNPQAMGMGANPFAGFGATPGATGTGTGTTPLPPIDFSSMFGAPPFGGAPGTTTTVPQADPATRFAPQLQQLQDMGFNDRDRNIQALQQTGGNLNAAIDRLLSGALG